MKRRRLALTTGQAAEFCLVTSDTIVNWIRSGLLDAQRTAGGQYRIRRGDLRHFMASRGMRTDVLDREDDARVPCWRFHEDEGRGRPSACGGCVVRFVRALDCFKLMGMRPGPDHVHERCEDCEYFDRWGAEPDDEEVAE